MEKIQKRPKGDSYLICIYKCTQSRSVISSKERARIGISALSFMLSQDMFFLIQEHSSIHTYVQNKQQKDQMS